VSPIFVHPFLFGLVITLGFWVAFSVLLSHIGGWGILGRQYGCSEEYVGGRWRFQSGQMRYGVGYNHCLAVGANRDGLHISLVAPFLLGHPALIIPWREISGKESAVVQAGATRSWAGDTGSASDQRTPGGQAEGVGWAILASGSGAVIRPRRSRA